MRTLYQSNISIALQKIMTFIGDDDIRISVTFADTVEHQDGYDPEAVLIALSSLVDVPKANIVVAGKKTSAEELEPFLESTLHEPKSFTISDQQIASISSLHVINRRLNKTIEELLRQSLP